MTRILLRTTQEMYLRLNTDSLSQNHCCRGEAVSCKYSECVTVALASQHADRIRLIIFPLWPMALLYFSILSHYRRKSWKIFLNIKFILIFSTILSENFLF